MKYSYIIALGLITVVCFNNCSFTPPFKMAEVDMDSFQNPPGDGGEETERIQGEKLYAANCASCHNEISTSTKLNRTEEQISAAIATQGQMKFLSFLTSADIHKISIALSPVGNPPPVEEKMASDADARVGNRFLVQSNLKEIFVADSQTDSFDDAILKVLNTNVTLHPEAFGGACTRYDANCAIKICGLKGSDPCEADVAIKTTAVNAPTGNVLRKGYTTRTCEEILAVDKAVLTALSKADVKTEIQPNPLPTAANISSFMSFFYMNKPITQQSVDQLVAVAAEAQSKGMNMTDQWRFVMLPICVSSFSDLL